MSSEIILTGVASDSDIPTPSTGKAAVYAGSDGTIKSKNDAGVVTQVTKTVAAPVSVGTANAAGTSTNLAAADHVHNHDVQTDPTFHAAVTPSANGFMTAADKTKLNHYPSPGSLGAIIYVNSLGDFVTLAGNTTTKIKKLTQVGDGVNSAVPTWEEEGWHFITSQVAGSATNTLPSGTFGDYDILKMFITVRGYAAPGDTVALQFNADTGNNYRYRWLQCAAGATTFTAPRVGATTDRIFCAAADTQNGRQIEVYIQNTADRTEKLVNIFDQTGTGSVATQGAIELGNGAYFTTLAATRITSINLMTSVANFGANTGYMLLGKKLS